MALARAHRWRQLLEKGRFASIRELAAAVGVDNSYVARQLRLTLLAPDIVEAVLEGAEPSGLSLEKLYAAPVGWDEQRHAVRMAGEAGARFPDHLAAPTGASRRAPQISSPTPTAPSGRLNNANRP